MAIQGVSVGISDYSKDMLHKKATESGYSTTTNSTGSQTADPSVLIQDVTELSGEANSLSQGAEKSMKTEQAAVTIETSAAETVITSTDGDTAEISAEAKQAAMNLASESEGTSEEASDAVSAEPKAAVAGTPKTGGTNQKQDLSRYTETQLKNMLNKDEITQQEYDTEMAKREAEGTAVEEEESAEKSPQQSSSTEETNQL